VFGWTNLQYIVSSAAASGTLEFDFNNTPGAFGLDDVTVQTLPPPILNSARVSGGDINLSWSAFVSAYYQIQSSTNLAQPGWTNVGSPFLATSNPMQVSLPIGNAPKRFYRVVMSPYEVTLLPAPSLNSAKVSGGNIDFSWGAFTNAHYQIQSSTNLAQSGWTNVGSPFLATSNLVQISLPIGNAPKRFYRVVVSP